MTEKQFKTKFKVKDPLPLKVEDSILIDSINNNSWEWQIDKSIEEFLNLVQALIEFKKRNNVEEQVAAAIADAFIQMGVLNHMFAHPIAQTFIERRLLSIATRNEKRNKPKGKVGF